MEQTEYFRTLHEYIAHLDADLKVDDEVYEERLALCKECEKLYQGMCRILRLLRGAAGSDEEEWLSACEADVDAGAGGECGILIAISGLSDN